MPKAEELNALLFLEGLQVPFVGATIRSSVNTFSTATIDIVPTDTIRSILPRTLTHIFWKDPVDGVFKLIFEGEIWGKSFSRSATERGMQLIAFSYDYHWDLSKRYYLDPIQSGSLGIAGVIHLMNSEGSAVGEQFPLSAGAESAIAASISNSDPNTPFLTKCINAVIVDLAARNKFYDIVNQRLRIEDRIFSATSDKIREVFINENAKKFIKNMSSGGSHISTIRDLIERLISVVHHDYVSLAAPSYDPVSKKIKSYIFKPDCYVMPPPRCNVFFPDTYNSFNYTHRFDSDPTRIRYALPSEVIETIRNSDSLSKNFYMPDELTTNLAEMSTRSKDPNATIYEKRDSFYDYLTFEEKFRGIVSGATPNPPYMSQLLREKGAEVNYAANIANYSFFQQKYMARSVSVSGEIDPWLVPGFSCLILDDSQAKQNIIAHLKSTEIRINATEGGYTAVAFDNAREVESFSWTDKMYFDEDLKKIVSNKMDEPQIPRWFDETWGKEAKVKLSSLKTSTNTGKIDKRDVDVYINQFDKINEKFSALLDNEGGQSITSWENNAQSKNTILEATYRILNRYKAVKKQGIIENWINKFKKRRLPTITETFEFIGAQTQQKVDGIMVGGIRYSGALYNKNTGKKSYFDGYHSSEKSDTTKKGADERSHIELRRSVINAYRKEIIQNKGFLG